MKRIYAIHHHILIILICMPIHSFGEDPVPLTKLEGSKSFDMEINQLNQNGILLFNKGNINGASNFFNEDSKLVDQFRDPGRGMIFYNLALTLHKLGKHKSAATYFHRAKKFARGNSKILNSWVLMRECEFNPEISCKKPPVTKEYNKPTN